MAQTKVRGCPIRLVRPFWGHKAGAKGRLYKGKIYLKGSRPARTVKGDFRTLYVYTGPCRR